MPPSRWMELDFNPTAEASFRLGVYPAVDPPQPPPEPPEPPETFLPFELGQAYPNPFNPETRIRYTLPQGGAVGAVVYDVRGGRVRSLIDDVVEEGDHFLRWDGRNDDGNQQSNDVDGLLQGRTQTVDEKRPD